MNTFLKTFFVCLILCLGFIGYKYLNSDSYSPNLEVNKENGVFTSKQTKPAPSEVFQNETTQELTEAQKEEEIKEEKQEFSHVCYFYSPEGKLTKYTRTLQTPPKAETSITLLLKGPLLAESKKGIYSEIPGNTDLISVKRNGNNLIVDLTSRFGEGGGSQSIENRLNQLSKTIKAVEPNRNIYLYIDGKQVEYLGGDGVYVKQPL